MDAQTIAYLRRRATALELDRDILHGLERRILQTNPVDWLPRLPILLRSMGWVYDHMRHTITRTDRQGIAHVCRLGVVSNTVVGKWLGESHAARMYAAET